MAASGPRGRRSTQSLQRSCGAVAAAGPRLPFAWQAQYTEPPHFPCAWQAQYTELSRGAAARWPLQARGCFCLAGAVHRASGGRRSTQSFVEELRRGGRRWPAAAFCLAGAVHRASALPLCVAGAVHRAFYRGGCGAVAAAGPRLPFAWQAQYTEPPHFPFAWQAQYTELCRGAVARWPPLARGCLAGVVHRASALPFCVAGALELSGGAAARWPPLARGCLLPGRRSTQSLRTSLLRGRRST